MSIHRSPDWLPDDLLLYLLMGLETISLLGLRQVNIASVYFYIYSQLTYMWDRHADVSTRFHWQSSYG